MNGQLERLKLIMRDVRNLALVGAYWGDEGKGAVTDWLLNLYNHVVRFSGGNNAGHTVYTPDGKKLVSHLIPSGLAQGKPCYIGAGVFINLNGLVQEIRDAIKILGSKPPLIMVDWNCPLHTRYHALLERYFEWTRGGDKIHTTLKAIGPLAGLDALRSGIRIGDLGLDQQLLLQKLTHLHQALQPCFATMVAAGSLKPSELPMPEEEMHRLLSLQRESSSWVYVGDASAHLGHLISQGSKILFEGSQAAGLDRMYGTYPFVTSGMALSNGAPVGTGLPPDVIDGTMMVAKVLPTRVGAGPFPSELGDRRLAEEFAVNRPELFEKGEGRTVYLETLRSIINAQMATHTQLSQYFMVLGYELGATSGRGRSIGLPDLQWLRYAIRINGANWLALTRFDMLSGVNSIPVVTGYRLGNKTYGPNEMPYMGLLSKVEVITEEWPCWREDITGHNREEDLPKAAREFIARMEQEIGIPIPIIKTGPERDAVIIREPTVDSSAA